MAQDPEDSSIENRVYLFKDLAVAWIAAHPGADREARLAALADLAYVSCVVADGEDLDPEEVAAEVRRAPT